MEKKTGNRKKKLEESDGKEEHFTMKIQEKNSNGNHSNTKQTLKNHMNGDNWFLL